MCWLLQAVEEDTGAGEQLFCFAMYLPFRRAVSGRAGLRRSGSAATPAASSLRPISNTAAVKSSKEARKETAAGVSYEEMRYANPLALPRLPIPRLEDTVSRYLQVKAEDRVLCSRVSGACFARPAFYV